MAKWNYEKMKQVTIDGVPTYVPEQAQLKDIVPAEVKAVETYNSALGKPELITKESFNRPLPEGFVTHLSDMKAG